MVKDTSTETIRRVAMYIRVSTDEQKEKYGVDLQRSAIEAMINSRSRLDNKLVSAGEQYVYIDDGISGTIPVEERPAFARLEEDLINSTPENRPFDIVAVYKIDRFARKLSILLDITKFLEETSVEFISVNESIDTSTPFGRAMLGIIGVIAELEIETIKMRTQGGREEAARLGTSMGNAPLYGFRKNLPNKYAEIFEEEAKNVRLIFDWFTNDKLSAGQIATKLKELKILSPEESAIYHEKHKGKKSKKKNTAFHWTPMSIFRILSDEIYVGKYYYGKSRNGKPLPKEQWSLSDYSPPQIIDSVQFEKARRLLKQSKHERKRTVSGRTYLLSGLLTCDCCYDLNRDRDRGRRHWVGTPKKLPNGRYTYSYNCGRKSTSKYDIICPTLPLPGEEIEKYVVEFSRMLLVNPKAAFEYQLKLKSTQKGIEHLRWQENHYTKLIDGVPGRILRVKEQHEHGHINFKEFERRVREANIELLNYNEKLSDARRQIAEQTLSKGYFESIKLFSDKYSKILNEVGANREEAYQVIHNLIEEIIVYSRPTRKTDIIAGIRRKDQHQQIPYRLHMKLKLPQDLLQELGSSGYKTISGAR